MRLSRGFTLIETAIVTAVVGVGVVSMMQLFAAGTVSNAAAAELTTAANLANNVHEIAVGLAARDPQSPTVWATKEGSVAAYDDVLDLDNETFNPPLDVTRAAIADMAAWAQAVRVESVAQDNLPSLRPGTVTEPAARVTVTVTHDGRPIYQTAWVISVTE